MKRGQNENPEKPKETLQETQPLQSEEIENCKREKIMTVLKLARKLLLQGEALAEHIRKQVNEVSGEVICRDCKKDLLGEEYFTTKEGIVCYECYREDWED